MATCLLKFNAQDLDLVLLTDRLSASKAFLKQLTLFSLPNIFSDFSWSLWNFFSTNSAIQVCILTFPILFSINTYRLRYFHFFALTHCLQAMPVRPPQPLLQTGALFGVLAHFFFFKHLFASQGIAIHFAAPSYAKIILKCTIGLPLAKSIFVSIVRVSQKLRYWRVLEVCLDYFVCVCPCEINREVCIHVQCIRTSREQCCKLLYLYSRSLPNRCENSYVKNISCIS